MATKQSRDPNTSLGHTLAEIAQHPIRTLLTGWHWKAAFISALIRASTFFAANLRAGSHSAVRAMLVEAVFAIVAAGFMGAIVQRLRDSRPLWATALLVWLVLPSLMLTTQFTWHHLLGTPHLKAGLITSFCFASISSGFNLFAMRRGAMLIGHKRSLAADMRMLPRIILDFVLAIPRAMLRPSR